MKIYADNAATTRMGDSAVNAMVRCMQEVYGNPSTLHSVGREARKALDAARASIAKNLGCRPNEVYFTSGGSEADNQAILSAAEIGEKAGKKHIISAKFEHHAVLHTLDKLRKRGFDIELLDVPECGVISEEQVREAIRPDTCLVTVMFANNEIGTVQPIGEIGEICRRHKIPFHTDAVQAVGHIPVNVKKMNIDMLSLSGHKFHGPKGVGVLYAKNGIPLANLVEGGQQERGKRAGTENVPAIVGMAAALNESCANMEKTANRVREMRDYIINEITTKVPKCYINGSPQCYRLPSNINFSFEDVDGESLLLELDRRGVCVSSGSACNSGDIAPSHVLLAIGRSDTLARNAIRISLGDDITREQADYIVSSVRDSVLELRKFSIQ